MDTQNSFKLSGTKESLEELRAALLKEPQAAGLTIETLAAEPKSETNEPTRVRSAGLDPTYAMLMFAIHIPAGVAAHSLYDWLHTWLKKRTDIAQVRIREIAREMINEELGRTSKVQAPSDSSPQVRGKGRPNR